MKIFFSFSTILLVLIGTSVYSLELKNLCNDRISKNDTYQVNSYYRLKFNKTLPSMKYYFNNTFDYETQSSKKLKNLVNEIYSENFVNSTKLTIGIKEKESQLSRSRDNYYDYNSERNAYNSDIKKIESFLSDLKSLDNNFLTKSLLSLDDLQENLKKLNSVNELQESIFKNQFIDIFYEQPLAKLDGLRLHRKNPIYNDYSTDGTLYFSLYVPFNDKTQSNVKTNCTCADYLPKFYTVETVPVEKSRTEQNEDD